MRFADKLFVLMAILFGVLFSLFGLWMLNSNFSVILDRELDRSAQENQMFQYLFEMGYQNNKSFGGTYAINKTLDSVVGNIQRTGSLCYVLDVEGNYISGKNNHNAEELQRVFVNMVDAMEAGDSYANGVRQVQTGEYYAICVCISEVNDIPIYLGMTRDITPIYKDRDRLINEYRIALIASLLIGGVCIYIFARFITAPMHKLEEVAAGIAEGDYNRRAEVESEDEVGELAESFNQMADVLVKQMQEREDFTAAFAHELKTPLTSIIGYADMLNTMKMSEEETREAYYYIFSQGKRLESLSHKLLELVSMDKHPIVSTAITTKEISENIQAAMYPIWKKRQIKGKVSLEKGTLHGDKELLLSLFYNLLDNAVKAVEPGGFVMMKGQNTQEGYEIRIVDNGRGIPKEEISRITEAFYMVDKSRSRKEGGAGIGMALCKKIIELHSGELRINSKLNMGTVISIVFKEKSTVEEEEAAEVPVKKKKRGKGEKVSEA